MASASNSDKQLLLTFDRDNVALQCSMLRLLSTEGSVNHSENEGHREKPSKFRKKVEKPNRAALVLLLRRFI